MRLVADLHVHSRYSRATSREADLNGFHRWARVKGIDIVGTGDFTHPQWFRELTESLVERDGLYVLKDPPRDSPLENAAPADRDVRFLLTTEISSIYRKHGVVRKVHSLIGVPALDDARRLSEKLSRIGNIASDGRPILGLDPKDLLSLLLEINEDSFLIPAHIWTPWFSIFGSKSGFDRIEDCFEELTPRIFALETGLSSDPAMNWRWSALDRYRLVSNSDAHSPPNLGREANLLDTEPTWRGVTDALRTGRGFLGTCEFYPEEGKYHLDGHRKCGICWEPARSREAGGICPVCGTPLTIGVLSRVMALADRAAPAQPRLREPARARSSRRTRASSAHSAASTTSCWIRPWRISRDPTAPCSPRRCAACGKAGSMPGPASTGSLASYGCSTTRSLNGCAARMSFSPCPGDPRVGGARTASRRPAMRVRTPPHARPPPPRPPTHSMMRRAPSWEAERPAWS